MGRTLRSPVLTIMKNINTLVEADSDILNPIIIAAIEEAENDNRVTFSEALQKAIKRHYELNKGVI